MEQLRQILIDKGASIVSFSDVSHIPQAKGFKGAITIGYKLNSSILSEVISEPTYEYFHHYRTVNACLDQLSLFACTYIERLGYSCHMIPASQSSITDRYAGAFSHKLAGVLSGAGYIGKNALFITPEFGSGLRLATVLHNYPLEVTNKPMQSQCGDCNICTTICPAGAIKGNHYILGESRDTIFDANACSQHMKKAYQHIGRGSVCGLCITSCPKTKKHLNKLK